MLNQVVLVGRIVEEVQKEERGYKMRLAIPRSFKNAEGEYETDFIEVQMLENVGNSVKEYCKKGDIVGVKGRLQSSLNSLVEVVAEKVTFLSSKGNN